MKKYVILLLFLSHCTLSYGTKLPDNIVLSVMYFDNASKSHDFDWMRKGIADMVISDLSKIKKIKVVQRENLQKVLEEQKLALTGIISEDSAVKAGNILGANVILLGSFIVFNNEIRIDGQLIDIKTSEVIDGVMVAGKVSKFLLLEKQFSMELLKKLGVKLTPENQKLIKHIETENLDALKYNYEGISAIDDKQIAKALELFKKATQIAPEYKSAQNNYAYFSKNVSGENIFSEAFSQLDNKTDFLTTSKKLLEDLADEIVKKGFIIRIGEPIISTDINNPDKVNIKVDVKIALDKKVRNKIFKAQQSLKGGWCKAGGVSYGISTSAYFAAYYADFSYSRLWVDYAPGCIAFFGKGADFYEKEEKEYRLNKYFYNLLKDLKVVFIFADKDGNTIIEVIGASNPIPGRGRTGRDHRVSTCDLPFKVLGMLRWNSDFHFFVIWAKERVGQIILAEDTAVLLKDAKKITSIISRVER
ncbi:MAG: CsgG/HfaB family protein [Elusimicrobiota bacterium]